MVLMASIISVHATEQVFFPELLEAHTLNIRDPSGLTIDRSGAFLWTVSDIRGGSVYAISMTGEILTRLSYDGHDIEGITQDPETGALWLAEERLRQVVQIDRTGSELQRIDIPVPVSRVNTGLEGIAFNPREQRLFLANQNLPRWIVEIDVGGGSDHGTIVNRVAIDFPHPFTILELSGLWYDPDREELWILSSASARIVVVNRKYVPQRVYMFRRVKFEGVAVDIPGKHLYLVNDLEDRLYVFSLEGQLP